MSLVCSCWRFGWCKPCGAVLLTSSGFLGCTTLDAMCLYEKPFMWYSVKWLLKGQVNEVHCLVVTRVVGVNDKGKEVKQAWLQAEVKQASRSQAGLRSEAAAFVSEAMLRVTYQVVALKVCDYLSLYKPLHCFANYRFETNWSVVSRFLSVSFFVNCSDIGRLPICRDYSCFCWFVKRCTLGVHRACLPGSAGPMCVEGQALRTCTRWDGSVSDGHTRQMVQSSVLPIHIWEAVECFLVVRGWTLNWSMYWESWPCHCKRWQFDQWLFWGVRHYL